MLDIMLPGISGHDVCNRMRQRKDYTPVLMLTALDGVDEKVAGLQKGADDYLSKPFAFDELIARVNAMIRRDQDYTSAEVEQEASGDPIAFDKDGLCLLVDGVPVELSAKERDFMNLLIANTGKALSRERVLNSVWGLNEDPMTNTVDVYIRRLRAKLGPYAKRIASVRGVGYRYD